MILIPLFSLPFLPARKAMPAKRRLSTAVGSSSDAAEATKMADNGNSPRESGSEGRRSATPEPGRKRKKIDLVSSLSTNELSVVWNAYENCEFIVLVSWNLIFRIRFDKAVALCLLRGKFNMI